MGEPRHVPDRGRWRPAGGFLVAALALVGVTAVAWWPSPDPAAPGGIAGSASGGTAPEAPAQVAASAASAVVLARAPAPAASAPSAPAPRIARLRDPNGDQTPDISDYINAGEKPTMNEVIARLHAAGVHTGLGAFNPPGTRPPMIGLAVPEDFPLPPGYVRHYQATDDGQRIEPILMFAPGYQARTPDGQPVPMPADRIVPPELAPPGLPIRRITVPAPIEGS